jgi:hypothetical protein
MVMNRSKYYRDVGYFRRQQSRLPLHPYEVFTSADRWSAATKPGADAILEEGWTQPPFPTVRLRPPIAWDDLCSKDRSWHFRLHCWDALAPVLAAYAHTDDPRYLDFAVSTAVDWAECYPSTRTTSPFAWYDMATGLRAYRLAFILDAAARTGACDDQRFAQLLDCVVLHAQVLADDDCFATHSNHGFYVAAGQLALARRFPALPRMRGVERQAHQRLLQLIHTQFSEEGVHREHSPEYHRMVFETLHGLLASGLLEDRELLRLNDQIQEALAWFVLPNGYLAMFGDSPRYYATSRRWPRSLNQALRFVVSGGQDGTPPTAPMRAFPASGYAVVRGAWPRGADDFAGSSYLAQTCAFHSRVHKHADDLSFIWYDHGHELLVDAGRFGYLDRTEPGSDLWNEGFWYADPNRVYVESTRAHNTVEIDGCSFQRRGVKPYGSALQRWGDAAGVFYTESHVRHRESVRHARVLLFRPGDWLIVFDWLWDNRQRPHRFLQRFHFAPELAAEAAGPTLRLELPDSAERLHMVPLLPTEMVPPVRGQREPDLLGWSSRRDGTMTPCWTGGYAAAGVPHATFATLFAFGDQTPEPGHGLESGSRASRSGRNARLRWRHADKEHTVTFARPADGQMAVDYRVSPNTQARSNSR